MGQKESEEKCLTAKSCLQLSGRHCPMGKDHVLKGRNFSAWLESRRRPEKPLRSTEVRGNCPPMEWPTTSSASLQMSHGVRELPVFISPSVVGRGLPAAEIKVLFHVELEVELDLGCVKSMKLFVIKPHPTSFFLFDSTLKGEAG